MGTNSWEIESGTYEILVGASVRDIRLKAAVEIQGTDAEIPETAKADFLTVGELSGVPDAAFSALIGRDIPESSYGETFSINDPLDQLGRAKNPIARLVFRVMDSRRKKSLAAGKPDLNILFMFNMPFRGTAKMTGGMITMKMADAIVFMVNGHWHRGLGRLIGRFFRKKKLSKMEGKKK